MDKVKTNFVIVISVLAILCVVLAGYAMSLNGQLGAEKTKTLQLNDRIAGLNTKTNDLQTQLTTAVNKANDEANLAGNLQNTLNNMRGSLDAANAELEKLKTAYADLELKTKAQAPGNIPQPAAKQAVPSKE